MKKWLRQTNIRQEIKDKSDDLYYSEDLSAGAKQKIFFP